MLRLSVRFRALCAVAAVAALAVGTPVRGEQPGDTPEAEVALEYELVPEAGNFLIRMVDGKSVCGAARPEEVPTFLKTEQTPDLHVINPKHRGANGFTIVLRGTSQLNANATARQAFIEAAAVWESRISSPITIIIDVDYGTKFFGSNFGIGVIGATLSQGVLYPTGYSTIRQKLIDRASNAQEAAYFNALPAASLPTDNGPTSAVYNGTPVFRALGMLKAVADPDTEPSIGAPPKIGFNSAIPFDFDPSNGIDGDKLDFDATVVHEIGHAIGFLSRVGDTDLFPFHQLSVTGWDLFRFRPGVNSGTIGTANRVLDPGGSQIYFDGDLTLSLSTARQDGSGGDTWQASHWKERNLNHDYIGIMDPAGANGDRDVITDNDLQAIDFFGYSLSGGVAPAIGGATAALDLDTLTITGTGTDGDANTILAEVQLLDASNAPVGDPAQLPANTGFQGSFDFSFEMTGLSAQPTATKASVVLIDGNGNRSSAMTADFSQADPGGPSITSVAYKANKGKLVIKGSGFSGTLSLEVNGQIVAPPAAIKPGKNGTVLKITGTLSALNFRTGPDRVRVVKDGKHSNIAVATF
jgi:hypothetical protein